METTSRQSYVAVTGSQPMVVNSLLRGGCHGRRHATVVLRTGALGWMFVYVEMLVDAPKV